MVKNTSIVLGVIFVIVGIWGFFQNMILGIFAADYVSSIIHIIVGIILLAMAAKPSVLATLKTIGIIYVLFGIVGFVSGTTMLGIFAVNGAASWLYLVLGVIIAVLGWTMKIENSSSEAPQM